MEEDGILQVASKGIWRLVDTDATPQRGIQISRQITWKIQTREHIANCIYLRNLVLSWIILKIIILLITRSTRPVCYPCYIAHGLRILCSRHIPISIDDKPFSSVIKSQLINHILRCHWRWVIRSLVSKNLVHYGPRCKHRGMLLSLFPRVASRTRNPVPLKNGLRFSSTTKAVRPRLWTGRPWVAFSAAAVLSIGTYIFGAVCPPPPLSILFSRPAPGPPADSTSPESIAVMGALEEKLQNLPQLRKIRESPDADEWYETRPYHKYPEEKRVNSLTAGTLRGPGKLACMPLVRAKKDDTESMVFIHVGRALCGHDGIIHGGLLAALLDESLARTVRIRYLVVIGGHPWIRHQAIINLPDKIGVTAKLTLNYRAPTRADQVCLFYILLYVPWIHVPQFIVIHTSLVEAKGRKAVVSGRVEDLDGGLLVEAKWVICSSPVQLYSLFSSAIFVQPRYAKLLNAKQLRKAMGDVPQEKSILLADGQEATPSQR